MAEPRIPMLQWKPHVGEIISRSCKELLAVAEAGATPEAIREAVRSQVAAIGYRMGPCHAIALTPEQKLDHLRAAHEMFCEALLDCHRRAPALSRTTRIIGTLVIALVEEALAECDLQEADDSRLAAIGRALASRNEQLRSFVAQIEREARA